MPPSNIFKLREFLASAAGRAQTLVSILYHAPDCQKHYYKHIYLGCSVLQEFIRTICDMVLKQKAGFLWPEMRKSSPC